MPKGQLRRATPPSVESASKPPSAVQMNRPVSASRNGGRILSEMARRGQFRRRRRAWSAGQIDLRGAVAEEAAAGGADLGLIAIVFDLDGVAGLAARRGDREDADLREPGD